MWFGKMENTVQQNLSSVSTDVPGHTDGTKRLKLTMNNAQFLNNRPIMASMPVPDPFGTWSTVLTVLEPGPVDRPSDFPAQQELTH
jgi:hypothetical protein